MNDLAIKDIAEQTGIAAGTIRMWEQRYGFPEPERTRAAATAATPSDDVEALRRVQAYRHRGLSVPAAIERARESGAARADRPSIYAAVAVGSGTTLRPQVLRKSTLIALSRAIEHEALAHAAAPVLVGAFQHEPLLPRRRARATGGSRARPTPPSSSPTSRRSASRAAARSRSRSTPRDALGNEWAVIIDAPGYAACLLGLGAARASPSRASADDRDRRFEAIWTLDPRATRRAAQVGARARRRAPTRTTASALEELLADRPLALEEPAPALTALTNRMIAYMEAGA